MKSPGAFIASERGCVQHCDAAADLFFELYLKRLLKAADSDTIYH